MEIEELYKCVQTCYSIKRDLEMIANTLYNIKERFSNTKTSYIMRKLLESENLEKEKRLLRTGQEEKIYREKAKEITNLIKNMIFQYCENEKHDISNIANFLQLILNEKVYLSKRAAIDAVSILLKRKRLNVEIQKDFLAAYWHRIYLNPKSETNFYPKLLDNKLTIYAYDSHYEDEHGLQVATTVEDILVHQKDPSKIAIHFLYHMCYYEQDSVWIIDKFHEDGGHLKEIWQINSEEYKDFWLIDNELYGAPQGNENKISISKLLKEYTNTLPDLKVPQSLNATLDENYTLIVEEDNVKLFYRNKEVYSASKDKKTFALGNIAYEIVPYNDPQKSYFNIVSNNKSITLCTTSQTGTITTFEEKMKLI